MMICRLLALAGIAAILSGCGLVVSQNPVFPETMVASDPALEGLYTLRGPSSSGVAVVTRDGANYHAALYEYKRGDAAPGDNYRQSGAADFQLIPLDQGDYAVQVSCVLGGAGSIFLVSDPDGPPYQYAVLIAARARQNFWLGVFPSGPLFESKYGMPKLKGGNDAFNIGGIDTAKAQALFRDWRDLLLEAGGENLSPIVRASDESFQTPAPNDPHPKSCTEMLRSVASHARKPAANTP